MDGNSQPTAKSDHPAGPIQEPDKNPVLAAILSLIFPGLGQFYNGESGKGVSFVIVGLLGFLTLPLGGFLIVFFLWIYSIVDAHSSAKRLNEAQRQVFAREAEMKSAKSHFEDSVGASTPLSSILDSLKKVHSLHRAGILDDRELSVRAQRLSSQIPQSSVIGDPFEILIVAGKLRDDGIIGEETLQRVKLKTLEN